MQPNRRLRDGMEARPRAQHSGFRLDCISPYIYKATLACYSLTQAGPACVRLLFSD